MLDIYVGRERIYDKNDPDAPSPYDTEGVVVVVRVALRREKSRKDARRKTA